jgi:chaperonin GroES
MAKKPRRPSRPKPQATPIQAKIKLEPLGDRVIVVPLEVADSTVGGIVLPDAAKEAPQRGVVIAVGPGHLLDSGDRVELAITVDDVVLFSKYGGTDIEFEGQDLKILRESDILGTFPGIPAGTERELDDLGGLDDRRIVPMAGLPGDPGTDYPDDDELSGDYGTDYPGDDDDKHGRR